MINSLAGKFLKLAWKYKHMHKQFSLDRMSGQSELCFKGGSGSPAGRILAHRLQIGGIYV